MPSWTTIDELRAQLSPRKVIELFDDDGDGVIAGSDLTSADETVARVNDEVTSILFRKGFSKEQLDELVSDASLRRYATSILAQYAGERRTEFLTAGGTGPYDAIGERARGALVKLSRGELRSKKEDTAGANPIVGGDTNLGDPVFIVSRDPRYPGRPGPGGF